MNDVIVVGAGAAGFFGAIKCAETPPGARVTLLERGAHVLAKVRISGGGRCNVTNACSVPKELIKNYPRGGQALLGPFHKFQTRDTVAWFELRGVPLKTEPDGRMFPTTDTSFTIINALKEAAQKAGVTVKTNAGPESVARGADNKFLVTFKDGAAMKADRILLATGSAPLGYEWARAFGHTIVPPVPSLFTFAVPDDRLKGLAGIAVEKATVSLIGTQYKQTGPVLITHWGLSGPAVLKLSAWGARRFHEEQYRSQVELNWVSRAPDAARAGLIKIKATHPRKTVAANPAFDLPQRLWEKLAIAAGLPPAHKWADISNAQLQKLVEQLTASAFRLNGKSTFKEEFVTAGGVALDEVDFQTMESRLCPGLYFAGEILDIDGVTGGFNFQSAWTTSWLAGRAMASVGG